MDQGLIARRYAKALYAAAAGKNLRQKVYGLMQTLADQTAAQPQVGAVLANPFVADADKMSLLRHAAGADAETGDSLFDDFLQLLSKHKRLEYAPEIARAYCEIYRKENRIYKVTVTSAAPLSAETKAKIEDLVKRQAGEGSVESEFKVNPDLIGGFTIDFGSERLDASVKKQLADLRQSLLGS